jgi:hypothetical protein
MTDRIIIEPTAEREIRSQTNSQPKPSIVLTRSTRFMR